MSLLSNKKYIGVGVVAMALAVFVGLSKINHAPKTNVIKIGHSAPLTGGSAHIGKDTENGVRLAIEEENASGGPTIQGQTYQLELVCEDDAADPTATTNAA
jgi:branched-chain amino acid transport system substrate-binding protein